MEEGKACHIEYSLSPVADLVEVIIGRERQGVKKTADRVTTLQGARSASASCSTKKVTHPILSSRVKLTSSVTTGNVDLCLIDDARHHIRLAVVQELHALNRSRGHDARAMTGLSAIGNDLALRIRDIVEGWGTPEAEVCGRARCMKSSSF